LTFLFFPYSINVVVASIPNAITSLLRLQTGKTAAKYKPHPLLNPPLEREEAENSGAVISYCGRMQCAPTDEIVVVRGEDLRGFKNLGGLVDIIWGLVLSAYPERPVLSAAEVS
jgi:hypothetical protein